MYVGLYTAAAQTFLILYSIQCFNTCVYNISNRGQDLTQSTVGIAYLDTMCGSASVGIVQDGPRSTTSSASTFAHELGHLFNLEHDTSK